MAGRERLGAAVRTARKAEADACLQRLRASLRGADSQAAEGGALRLAAAALRQLFPNALEVAACSLSDTSASSSLPLSALTVRASFPF